MTLSCLDLFTIGIGPSSSHTVGPMKAARRFVMDLYDRGLHDRIASLHCDLYGSLAATGKEHGTDGAVLLGFAGERPDNVDIDSIPGTLAAIRAGRLTLPWGAVIAFDQKRDLDFKRLKPLPLHPNGMHFTAVDAAGTPLVDAVFYSLGGGFIATEQEMKETPQAAVSVPYPFTNAKELMAHAAASGLPVSQVLLANESAFRPEAETRRELDRIWEAMRGCLMDGVLPGGLKVPRRAKRIHGNIPRRPRGQRGGVLNPCRGVRISTQRR